MTPCAPRFNRCAECGHLHAATICHICKTPTLTALVWADGVLDATAPTMGSSPAPQGAVPKARAA